MLDFAQFLLRTIHGGRWALVLPLLLVACSTSEDVRERSATDRADYSAVEASLEHVSARYPEATDTHVRGSVLVAVYCAVVHEQPVPADFAMFSAEGDREVRSVVVDFVQRARQATAGLSKAQRIEVLWGDSWRVDVYLRPSDCSPD